jgi:hypothetical protein
MDAILFVIAGCLSSFHCFGAKRLDDTLKKWLIFFEDDKSMCELIVASLKK